MKTLYQITRKTFQLMCAETAHSILQPTIGLSMLNTTIQSIGNIFQKRKILYTYPFQYIHRYITFDYSFTRIYYSILIFNCVIINWIKIIGFMHSLYIFTSIKNICLNLLNIICSLEQGLVSNCYVFFFIVDEILISL